MMRVRTVEHSRVAFGGVEWGYPEVVVPVLAGSVVFADRIRAAVAGWSLPDGMDAFVSNPLHVQNLDGSLTIYEVQGGGTLSDNTMRDPAALAAWNAWCGGIGVEDAPG
jgi:hypothetical protein